MSTTPPPAPALTQAQERDVIRLIHEARPRGKPGYGLVRFETTDVQPPSTEYLTQDSYLQVNIFPTTPTSVITIAAKILLTDGKITVLAFNYTNFTAYTKNQFLQQLAEGFLLSLTVTASLGYTLQRGDTFVQVGVQFGPSPGTPMYRVLASGYVTTTVAIAWPEGNLQDSLTGPGLITTVSLGNPAAGSDFTLSFNVGTRNWVHALSATLTTSATVANRMPVFLFKDISGNLLWSLGGNTAQTASKTVEYNLGESAALGVDSAGNAVVTMPTEAVGVANWSIASSTAGLQAGDQWSSIRCLIEQWIQV